MDLRTAADVVALLKRNPVIAEAATVSEGRATGSDGIEVVVRQPEDQPAEGMRVLRITVLGAPGVVLDLVVAALQGLGFTLTGSPPIQQGRRSEIIPEAELAAWRASKAQAAQQQAKAREAQRVADREQQAAQELEALRGEIDRLRSMVEDASLLPAIRGARGLQGEPGLKGDPGPAGSGPAVADSNLADLADVSGEQPEETDVLSWVSGSWRPVRQRFTSFTSIGGGGGGSTVAQAEESKLLTYDSAGRLTGVTYASGSVAIDYDSAGRVAVVTREGASGTTIKALGYSSAGTLETITVS